jgi:hypothetical protein
MPHGSFLLRINQDYLSGRYVPISFSAEIYLQLTQMELQIPALRFMEMELQAVKFKIRLK